MSDMKVVRWKLEKALESIMADLKRKEKVSLSDFDWAELQEEWLRVKVLLEVLPKPWWDRRGR